MNFGKILFYVGAEIIFYTTISVADEDDISSTSNIKSLRSAKQITVSVEPSKYLSLEFHLDDDAFPVWVRVTPCGDVIKWKLVRLVETSDDIDDEISGSGSGADEISTNPIPGFEDDEDTFNSAIKEIKYAGTRASENQYLEEIMIQEVGSHSMPYYADNLPTGTYKIYITTLGDSQSSVQVYYSSMGEESAESELATLRIHSTGLNKNSIPELGKPINTYFPKLPNNQRLKISRVSSTSTVIAWDPVLRWGGSDKVGANSHETIEYCVVISPFRLFKTYCHVSEYLKEYQKSSNYDEWITYKLRPQPPPEIGCITGMKTVYEFGDLKPDTKYFVSVFAIDHKTNASSTYESTAFKTLERSKNASAQIEHSIQVPKEVTTSLKNLSQITSSGENSIEMAIAEGGGYKDPSSSNKGKNWRLVDELQNNGNTRSSENLFDNSSDTPVKQATTRYIAINDDTEIRRGFLNAGNTTDVYKYTASQLIRRLRIYVQPCTGVVKVTISTKLLANSTLQTKIKGEFASAGLISKKITRVRPGMLEIRVENEDEEAKAYNIWVSEKTGLNPYPVMPMDTSIQIPEKKRLCDRVTLQWMVARVRQDYSLYKHREWGASFKSFILEDFTQCRKPANLMADKVFSKKYIPPTDNRYMQTMNATVEGLRAATTYRFDLYVSRRRRLPVAYRTIWVKTRDSC